MIFVAGPRQVGKTTSCKSVGTTYQSWESTEVQRAILQGTEALAHRLELDVAHAKPPVIVFDELHKFPRWKNVLKGLYDIYADRCKIIVTGSSRLDVYRRGGDSLMGRYFLYRMHPFSVAECIDTTLPNKLTRQPCEIAEADWDALWQFGGFPEPFLKRKESFSRQWASLRLQQLSKEDIRETSQIQNLAQLGVLVQILAERSAEQLIYASLAQEVAVAPITVKGWISLLESLHYGFTVRPWHKKVANSLRKEPKWFLRDWSSIKDEGQKSETFVACHLLKACQGWTDLGLGSFDLHYLRTKQKKEVDFLVSKDGVPWSLFEVKHSERSLSKSLVDFQNQLKVPHAFQVVLDLPYEQVDCFSYDRAIVVPARTILSQLL
jgi:predicted AAA+ superfamily ATPase